jgi:hypothetical protein
MLIAIWLAGFIALYFLPTNIGRSRKIQKPGLLLFINFIVGWTVVGWVGCLLWAALAQDGTQRLLHQRLLSKQDYF